jgi:hypothetical protein
LTVQKRELTVQQVQDKEVAVTGKSGIGIPKMSILRPWESGLLVYRPDKGNDKDR